VKTTKAIRKDLAMATPVATLHVALDHGFDDLLGNLHQLVPAGELSPTAESWMELMIAAVSRRCMPSSMSAAVKTELCAEQQR
jgi:hypothetical protein